MAPSTKAKKRKPGVDAILNKRGKAIGIGQEIRFQLIKGPSLITSTDPTDPKAPVEAFPIVAKFVESVVKPNFQKYKRFYQQDKPAQKEDSDDDEARHLQQLAAERGRKKRRYRRNEGPRRQWVLQEEKDYLETQIAKKQQGKGYRLDQNTRSTRYEGIPEYNSSQYILIGASDDGDEGKLKVTTLPTPHAVFSFSQPAKMQTLSMSAAEQAIENQRAHMTRYMMHNKTGQPDQPPPSSKSRLLGKLKKLTTASAALAGDDDKDDDDVMGDLKFSSRKGSGSRARRELLSSLGHGVAIDGDGVLGGANDAEFGGKRRFVKMNAAQNNDDKKKASGSEKNAGGASNGGMAMAGDFYQRDVKAEYDELDFDANAQFDDDDVAMGEGEVNFASEGYREDYDEPEGDDEEEEEDDDSEGDGDKRRGLATIRGLKEMLAKERRGIPNNNDTTNKDGSETDKAAQGDSENKQEESSNEPTLPPRVALLKSPAIDENGQRILSMDGVRYEIFLHNKSIAMKKLMKLYNIKKKSSKDRIQKFQQIIKELCNMHKDPVKGNMLDLKQHYAKGI